MFPKRSYIVKAAYEWISDNNMTPYLLADAEQERVVVPRKFVKNGQILLNVSVSAVRCLTFSKEAISFKARFNTNLIQMYIPIEATLALYAKENGEGFVFPDEEFSKERRLPISIKSHKKSAVLKLVK